MIKLIPIQHDCGHILTIKHDTVTGKGVFINGKDKVVCSECGEIVNTIEKGKA